jgi:O-acetylhomoserine/O-acetylserine sulfhydrylase-like pyridoxal-dependent enzyme
MYYNFVFNISIHSSTYFLSGNNNNIEGSIYNFTSTEDNSVLQEEKDKYRVLQEQYTKLLEQNRILNEQQHKVIAVTGNL